ncbi:MarR family winged helix-turn-helix transcriptional regulator [Kineococcus gypseus]|uniref:MarR family winged helix-turn-helix transcriptional regulator n=1 Tax=Kineococcus gypseus TaxID=1637102 RepID=UPI003D7E672E
MPHHAPAATGAAPGARRGDLLPVLGEEVARSVRTLHALKSQDARGSTEADRAMHTVLLVVAHTGDQRVGELAERLGTDPSTISRQTAELVRQGLLERRRDPDDGRASRLAVTAAGRAVVATTLERRHERLARAVESWDDDELGTFVRLLTRFTDGLEQVRTEAGPAAAAQPCPALPRTAQPRTAQPGAAQPRIAQPRAAHPHPTASTEQENA